MPAKKFINWITLFMAMASPLLHAQENNMENKSMPDLSFATTVIYVETDAKKVLDFYQRAFGFSLKYYDENLDFGELTTGTTDIMICTHATGKIMIDDKLSEFVGGRPKNVELAFISEDVDASIEHAVQSGATLVQAARKFPWGQYIGYVRSIEGTLIAISAPLQTP